MVKKTASAREKNLIRLIVLTTAIWVVIASAIQTVVDILIPSQNQFARVMITLGGLALSVLLLYFGEEWLLKLLLRSVKVSSKEERDMCGRWHIEIHYDDPNAEGKKILRIGDLEISHSPTGLVIYGDKIRDRFTREEVIESWISEFAEVHNHNTHYAFLYAYKIKRPDNDHIFDKVGYVVLHNNLDTPNVFEGNFIDIKIISNNITRKEHLRSGNVILQRAV